MRKVIIKTELKDIKKIINSKLEFKMNIDLWEKRNLQKIDFILNNTSVFDFAQNYKLVVFNYKNTGKKRINKLHFIQGIKTFKKDILEFMNNLKKLSATFKKETKNPLELEEGDFIYSKDYSNWQPGKCFNGGNYGFIANGYIGEDWYFSTTHDWGCCSQCGKDLFNNDEHKCEPLEVSLNNIPYPEDVKFYKITDYKINITNLDEIIEDFKENGYEKLYSIGIKYLKQEFPELREEIEKKL